MQRVANDYVVARRPQMRDHRQAHFADANKTDYWFSHGLNRLYATCFNPRSDSMRIPEALSAACLAGRLP